MHGVAADIFAAHGAERAVAHVERDFRPAETGFAQAFAYFFGTVQTCRGGGDAADFIGAGVDRLIAPGVFFAVGAFDVGGQGNVPGGGEGLGQIAAPGKQGAAAAEGAGLQHGDGNARAEAQGFAVADAAPGADEAFHFRAQGAFAVAGGHGLPQHQRQGRQQQKFHLAARGAGSEQAGLKHAGIVGDKQRAFRQAVRQLGEHVVFQRSVALAGHDHEAGVAAMFGRELSYLFLRQLEGIIVQ